MSFWSSELGELSGKAEDAFNKSFGLIPDGTTALARIMDFKNDSFNGIKTYKIDWLLVDGEFKGQHTFQKIKAFDQDPKVRYKALNMLMLIFKMFNVKPVDDQPPTDAALQAFFNKTAGIKILETKPNDEGKTYNFVGEVHLAEGFKSATGERKVIAPKTVVRDDLYDTAGSRNGRLATSDDDIPW
jgi:hypothetical protein